jgi:hypothetical protein
MSEYSIVNTIPKVNEPLIVLSLLEKYHGDIYTDIDEQIQMFLDMLYKYYDGEIDIETAIKVVDVNNREIVCKSIMNTLDNWHKIK